MEKRAITTVFLFLLILKLINAQADKVSKSQNADTVTVTIIGVGDVMLGTSFPSEQYLPPHDNCSILLKEIRGVIESADVSFCNLEGCFLDQGPVVKKCKDTTICYAFRSPEKYFECIIDAGFNLFSLANNHMNDFGEKGSKSTTDLIDQNGLYAAGLITRPKVIFEKNGIKFGFCAFSPNKGTTRINNYKMVKRIISELHSEVDIIIVSFHGGAEGSAFQHVPREFEFYYNENRGNVYEFARIAIDAGADIVFGHGPHVTRAIDIYKNRFIAYSLGNFCTYKRMNLKGVNGIAPIIKVTVNIDGAFKRAEIIPIMQYRGRGPEIDPQGRVIHIVKELTAQDFPESGLIIHDDGIVVQSQ